MMQVLTTLALLGSGVLPAGVVAASASTKPLTSKAGQSAPIPNWHFQSSASVDNNLTALSRSGVETSSWHFVDAPSCTLMGCFLKSGVYKDDELWFSDALSKVNSSVYNVPWIYRNEFALPKGRPWQHFLLETHGITSKADLYLNGHEVANSSFQSGAYGGHSYDITGIAQENNVLAVRTYNTSYDYDFGISFEDWNPPAPDHGTGIWRDIDIRQTGPVAMKPLAVTTDIDLPIEKHDAKVTVYATARNLENRSVKLSAKCTISGPEGKQAAHHLHGGPGDGRDSGNPESLVHLGAAGVVDAGNDLLDAVGLAGDSGSEDIAVVPAAHGGEGVGPLDARCLEGLTVETDPLDGLAAEVGAQLAEGVGILVDDSD